MISVTRNSFKVHKRIIHLLLFILFSLYNPILVGLLVVRSMIEGRGEGTVRIKKYPLIHIALLVGLGGNHVTRL